MPGHLKHLQGGPGSAGVGVVRVGELLLLLLRMLLEPGRLGQQLSQSTLSLSLRPSMRSDVASSVQTAIVAWRQRHRDCCFVDAGQLHMRHSTTSRTNGWTGVQREDGSTRAGEHKQNSVATTRASARTNQSNCAHARPIYMELQRPTTSPPCCKPAPRFRPLYLASKTHYLVPTRVPCQSSCQSLPPPAAFSIDLTARISLLFSSLLPLPRHATCAI